MSNPATDTAPHPPKRTWNAPILRVLPVGKTANSFMSVPMDALTVNSS
jgi:hypothetical protein